MFGLNLHLGHNELTASKTQMFQGTWWFSHISLLLDLNFTKHCTKAACALTVLLWYFLCLLTCLLVCFEAALVLQCIAPFMLPGTLRILYFSVNIARTHFVTLKRVYGPLTTIDMNTEVKSMAILKLCDFSCINFTWIIIARGQNWPCAHIKTVNDRINRKTNQFSCKIISSGLRAKLPEVEELFWI